MIQWVSGGEFAVAVEVEIIYSRDDPSEPCLQSATIRYLEELGDRAQAGDLEALQQAGIVYKKVQPK
jgi:hypothetical protein